MSQSSKQKSSSGADDQTFTELPSMLASTYLSSVAPDHPDHRMPNDLENDILCAFVDSTVHYIEVPSNHDYDAIRVDTSLLFRQVKRGGNRGTQWSVASNVLPTETDPVIMYLLTKTDCDSKTLMTNGRTASECVHVSHTRDPVTLVDTAHLEHARSVQMSKNCRLALRNCQLGRTPWDGTSCC